ncbi:hypothetical protein [Kitasatospora sp. CB01950]|uniref:hypothetical protein n=1 Tax=Kitasatospora sp. CB01950 TaxID=1703930 RepID=UPI00093EE92D|nr:hypothetical protein [Kitasatospora sp. CB01950]OKI99862.1 hypothetical protein AMK19_30485 [Kitasatospora sp. CB01950]
MRERSRVLFVTDLAYPAQGRRYGDEDVFLTSRLRGEFDLALCHPRDAVALMDGFEAVVVRNSGPVLHYREEFDAFRRAARVRGTLVHNPLTGRGDMAGKGYLLELTAAGYPVIPTVGRPADVALLPRSERYVVKPRAGADSIGLSVVDRAELAGAAGAAGPAEGAGPAGTAAPEPGGARSGEVLVQPLVDFRYEVSFYFVDGVFQYALYAPDPSRRWELTPYPATAADLAFAQRFVDWNTLAYGIQRVDACRTVRGELLLVELEDLNPYLSLDVAPPERREAFVAALAASIRGLLRAGRETD